MGVVAGPHSLLLVALVGFVRGSASRCIRRFRRVFRCAGCYVLRVPLVALFPACALCRTIRGYLRAPFVAVARYAFRPVLFRVGEVHRALPLSGPSSLVLDAHCVMPTQRTLETVGGSVVPLSLGCGRCFASVPCVAVYGAVRLPEYLLLLSGVLSVVPRRRKVRAAPRVQFLVCISFAALAPARAVRFSWVWVWVRLVSAVVPRMLLCGRCLAAAWLSLHLSAAFVCGNADVSYGTVNPAYRHSCQMCGRCGMLNRVDEAQAAWLPVCRLVQYVHGVVSAWRAMCCASRVIRVSCHLCARCIS